MGRIPAARLALILPLLAAALLLPLVLRRVPEGKALVLAGSPPRVLGPGLHVVRPGGRGGWIALGRHEVTFRSEDLADYVLYDVEAKPVAAELRLAADLNPESLARLTAAHGDVDPTQAVASALRPALRRFVAGRAALELFADPAPRESAWRPELAAALRSALGPEWSLDAARFFPAGARAESTPHRRVLLVGVDAGDWKILRPLLDAGQMPHVAALMARGASGPLRSFLPLLSPLVWTTIATGVSPERHGILDFIVRNADGTTRPVGSTDRRAPALWNLLEPCGRRVAVVGWLATYPAESVPGTIITDRFGFLAFVGENQRVEDSRVTWPPELAAEAETHRVKPPGLDPAWVRRFAHVPAESVAAAGQRGFGKGRRLDNLVLTLAQAETNRRLALWQWETGAPDVGLFYFELVDAVGHLCMPYAPPRSPWITEAAFQTYRDAVDEAYRYQDAILGDLLAESGDSTLVVVLSDHGFKSGAERPHLESDIGERGAAHWHTLDGILVLAGPGVRSGVTIEGATVADVTPTLLAWLGCPVPSTMEGRVLNQAFATPLRAPVGAGAAPTPTPPPPAPGTASTAAGLNNLGLRHLSAGRLPEALAAFQEAVARDPRSITARNNLGMTLLRLDRLPEARRELEQAVAMDAGYPPAWLNLGLTCLGLHDPARARAALLRAVDLDPGNPRVLRGLGFACLDLDRFPEAKEAFTRALAQEETAPARFGLGVALQQTGDTAGARREFTRALVLDPGHVDARRALRALGGPG